MSMSILFIVALLFVNVLTGDKLLAHRPDLTGEALVATVAVVVWDFFTVISRIRR